MRITDLQVDGFGVWSGLSVDKIETGLTVFYGPNEAGKTTLLQFVRAVLYGFAGERRDKYLPPVYGGSGGGSIHLDTQDGAFRVQRHDSPGIHSRVEGELALTAADGTVSGADALSRLLEDVDESVFSNVFAIGLREIQELATLNDTDAARELYKLASGLDRVSLIDVMRSLRNDREFISGNGEQRGRLRDLASELKEVERQLELARGSRRRWIKLGNDLADLDRELEMLHTTTEEREFEARQFEMAIQIAPRYRERDSIQRRIESLGQLPSENLVSISRLTRVNEKLLKFDARIGEVSKHKNSIRETGKALQLNRKILDQSCRIEAVIEHLPWMESLEGQIERLRNESADLQEMMGLGTESQPTLPADSEELDLEVSGRTLSMLKTPARALRSARQKLESAEQKRSQADLRMAATREELDSLLLEAGCDDLDEAIEDASEAVHQLKRRQQIEDRLVRLDKQRRHIEEEIEIANEAQMMPMGRTMLVGLLIVLGFGIALFGFSGWFLPSVEPNPTLGLFGVAIAMVGWVIKLVGDARARSRLERTQSQQELLIGQIQRARSEREDAARGTDDPRPVEEQLESAESNLVALEELIPYRAEVAQCQSDCDDVQLAFEQAEKTKENMQKRWESALRSVNLPATLTPARVKALSEQNEKLGQSRHRLHECRSELLDREAELERLSKRVSQLADESGLEVDDCSPKEQIDALEVELKQQRKLKEERIELRRQFKKAGKQIARLNQKRHRIESFRSRMFSRVAVENEQQYRDLAMRIEQRHELGKQSAKVDEQIDTALGSQFDRGKILEIVEEYGDSALETRWEKLTLEVDELEKKRGELNMLRGERTHEMKMLGEDRSACRLEHRAETIRSTIRQLSTRWRTLAQTNQILDSVRRRYEEQRQPETLNEASRYLAMISQNKYVRIWTRLEGDSLFVDQPDGKTLRVDVLSQGTREAIFLSLRLALASAYARRGIEFPLVLDDLLVNYDSERTHAAAEVLLEYATKNKQLVFFTCHDHVRDLFHEIGADVRVLPSHVDVLESSATAERYVVDQDEWEEVVDEQEEDLEALDEVLEDEVDEDEVEDEVDEELEEAYEDDDLIEAHDESDDGDADDVDEEEIDAEELDEEFDDEHDEETESATLNDEVATSRQIETNVEEAVEELLDAIGPTITDEVAPPPTKKSKRERQRFTWDSPDMWWEERDEKKSDSALRMDLD